MKWKVFYFIELSCFKGTLKLFHLRITWYLSISSIVFCFYSHARFCRFSRSEYLRTWAMYVGRKTDNLNYKSVPQKKKTFILLFILKCIQHIHIKLDVMSVEYFKALWLFMSKYFLKNYSCTYQYTILHCYIWLYA